MNIFKISPPAAATYKALCSAPSLVSKQHFVDQIELLISQAGGELIIPRTTEAVEPLYLLVSRIDTNRVHMVEMTSGADELGSRLLGLTFYFATGTLVLSPRWHMEGKYIEATVDVVGCGLGSYQLGSKTCVAGQGGAPLSDSASTLAVSMFVATGAPLPGDEALKRLCSKLESSMQSYYFHT